MVGKMDGEGKRSLTRGKRRSMTSGTCMIKGERGWTVQQKEGAKAEKNERRVDSNFGWLLNRKRGGKHKRGFQSFENFSNSFIFKI